MSLTLIGMSGAGKSFIGRIVAQHYGLQFVDTDDELEAAHGKKLPELIEEWGDDRFITEEGALAISRTSGQRDLLISTGGSIIYSEAAMAHLREISTVVYLKASEEEIVGRIDNSERIGRIVRLNGGSLIDLMRAREPLYERSAHRAIETAGRDASACLKAIVAAICKECHQPSRSWTWVRPKEGGRRTVHFFCGDACKTEGLIRFKAQGLIETRVVLGWDVFFPVWQ